MLTNKPSESSPKSISIDNFAKTVTSDTTFMTPARQKEKNAFINLREITDDLSAIDDLQRASIEVGEQSIAFQSAQNIGKNIQHLLYILNEPNNPEITNISLKFIIAEQKNVLSNMLKKCQLSYERQPLPTLTMPQENILHIDSPLNFEQVNYLVNKTNNLFNLEGNFHLEAYEDKKSSIISFPVLARNRKNEIIIIAPGIITPHIRREQKE